MGDAKEKNDIFQPNNDETEKNELFWKSDLRNRGCITILRCSCPVRTPEKRSSTNFREFVFRSSLGFGDTSPSFAGRTFKKCLQNWHCHRMQQAVGTPRSYRVFQRCVKYVEKVLTFHSFTAVKSETKWQIFPGTILRKKWCQNFRQKWLVRKLTRTSASWLSQLWWKLVWRG